jgi:hypothetical protein
VRRLNLLPNTKRETSIGTGLLHPALSGRATRDGLNPKLTDHSRNATRVRQVTSWNASKVRSRPYPSTHEEVKTTVERVDVNRTILENSRLGWVLLMPNLVGGGLDRKSNLSSESDHICTCFVLVALILDSDQEPSGNRTECGNPPITKLVTMTRSSFGTTTKLYGHINELPTVASAALADLTTFPRSSSSTSPPIGV